MTPLTSRSCRFPLRNFDRFMAGYFIACLRKEGVPHSVDEPVNSRSLTIDYMNLDGMRVCRVHMYFRPDGTIGGADGRPDPLQLIANGVKFVRGQTNGN